MNYDFSVREFVSLLEENKSEPIIFSSPYWTKGNELKINQICLNKIDGQIYVYGNNKSNYPFKDNIAQLSYFDIQCLYIKVKESVRSKLMAKKVKKLPESEYAKWVSDNIIDDGKLFEMQDKKSWQSLIKEYNLTIEDIIFPTSNVYGNFDNGAKYVVFHSIDRTFVTFGDVDDLHAEYDDLVDKQVSDMVKEI